MDLSKVKKLITHANCHDGIASAMIIHDAMPNVEIVFAHHGDKIDLEPGLLFCDCSPPADRVKEFVNIGTIVLDHHKQTKSIVEAFGSNGVFADEKTEPGVSGAVLAYRHVWKKIKIGWNPSENWLHAQSHEKVISEFARLAGIRDTWQKDDPDWLLSCYQAALLVFWPLDELLKGNNSIVSLRDNIGKSLYEKQLNQAKDYAKKSFKFVSRKGTRVAVFSGAGNSDASDYVEDTDLVVSFFYKVEYDKMFLCFSTRSRTDFDCGAFCATFGGGGHTKAAGFRIEYDANTDAKGYYASNSPLRAFVLYMDSYERNIEAVKNEANAS